jgi:hypothetical protein
MNNTTTAALRKIVIVMTILLGSYSGFSQETDNWYFGSAAGFANTGLRVSFTSGSPVVTTGYPILTEEGSSSISDASGSPLFYTDGVTVWDASTNTSFGTGLAGGSSSTQSAIIMPKPGATNQWLLFTSGTQGNPGVTYYTVSGTPGSFTISAGTTLVAAGIPGEGLCIVGHSTIANGFWVVSRDDGATGQIRSFLVNGTGVVSTTAVTSTLSGPSFTNTSYTSEIGTIKSNTCQNKLAFTYLNAHADLADFDASTGMLVANSARRITVTSGGGNSGSYGIEFSPNDAYLYITNLAGGQVYRHDIALNTTAVFGTVAVGNEAGQLQAAPDGNIYMANRNASPATAPNYLARIGNPGAAGATWTAQSVLLSGVTFGGNFGFVYRGLPTFPKSLVVSSLSTSPGNGAYCTGTSIPLSFLFAGSIKPTPGIVWSVTSGTGGTFTPGGATSTSATPSVSFSTTGTKVVNVTFTDICDRVYSEDMTFVISAPKVPTGTISCGANSLTLTATGSVPADYPNYIWYENSVADANIIGIGSPVNYTLGSNSALPTQICLGVAGGSPTTISGSNNIGPFNVVANASELTPKTSATFNVLADQLLLKSYNIGFRFAGTYTITTTIRDGSSTVVFTNTASTGAVAASTQVTIPVNTTLPMGTGYTITVSTPSPGVELTRGSWAGATNAGQITYNGFGTGVDAIANLQYDWFTYAASPVCSTPICYAVSCTLPVTMIDFSGTANQNSVLLNWSTVSEINNDYFEVQRSTDGIHFVTIGTVDGNGNSQSVQEYSFTDGLPSNGINYYRLVQYDFDGKASAGKIIEVNLNDGSNTFSVSPNPSTDAFKVNFLTTSGGELSVLDILGRELKNLPIAAGTEKIEIGSDLSKGVYILRYAAIGGVSTERVIKE